MQPMFKLPLLVLLFASRPAAAYPSSITLTDDNALAGILADIPIISVGILGFGVITFFVIMRRINWATLYIHFAVFFTFSAAIFDLSQSIRRGYLDVLYGLNISSVMPLVVLRETAHSLSFGFRFFFFWALVAEPLQRELPPITIEDNRRLKMAFLELNKSIHGGSWSHLGYVGFVLRLLLLLATLSVPILQGLWRLDRAFSRFGSVYLAETILEIILSVAFILKLLANVYFSSLMPRWRALWNYLPVMFALLVSIGIAIGNLLCFRFSESTLGRFFQAVEMYTLVLFVLVSAFYSMLAHQSVAAEVVRLTAVPSLGDNGQSTPYHRHQQIATVRASPNSSRNRDSQVEGDTQRTILTSRPSTTQHIRTNSILSFPLVSRWHVNGNRASDIEGGRDDQSRLLIYEEAEPGVGPVGQGSFQVSLGQTTVDNNTPDAADSPGWNCPVLASSSNITRDKMLPGSPALPVPSVQTRTNYRSAAADDSSLYAPDDPTRVSMVSQITFVRKGYDAPAFELEGIVRNAQVRTGETCEGSTDCSSCSSGFESVLRQQEELSRSIAGLHCFSESSNIFSLAPVRGNVSMKPLDTTPGGFSLISRRAPTGEEVTHEGFKRPSVLTVERESLDSASQVIGTGRVARLDSQGTQYDVTSFIGSLTTPAASASVDQTPDFMLSEIVTSKSLASATTSIPKSVQANGNPRNPVHPVMGDVSDTVVPNIDIGPMPFIPRPPIDQTSNCLPQGNGAFRGLQSGHRMRLEIGSSTSQNVEEIHECTAFRRPRLLPLVQHANDTALAEWRRTHG